jgi:hypothetical protein
LQTKTLFALALQLLISLISKNGGVSARAKTRSQKQWCTVMEKRAGALGQKRWLSSGFRT